MNRENFNFEFTNETDINNNVKRFSFGILYLLLFYLDFNLGLKIYIKEFLLDLYIHRYYPPYCKHALRALNNNYRYDWIMSSFEIHNRLFYNNKIKIKIYFTYDYYEIYYIDEHTTVYDLYFTFPRSEGTSTPERLITPGVFWSVTTEGVPSDVTETK